MGSWVRIPYLVTEPPLIEATLINEALVNMLQELAFCSLFPRTWPYANVGESLQQVDLSSDWLTSRKWPYANVQESLRWVRSRLRLVKN